VGQRLITAAFEADFIFGQFHQLENVPGSLVKLHEIAREKIKFDGRQALHFALFSQLLGICGNMGGRMKDFLFDNFMSSITALERLADGDTPQVWEASY
jgi:hypothetical protein